MAQHSPRGKRLPIALDEWAIWLPKDPPLELGPLPPAALKSPLELGLYGQGNTLRDALAEAAVYNLMQRRPKDFALASRTILYAYMAGLIGIARDRVVASPSARMLELYSTYDRQEALPVDVRGPKFDVPSAGFFLGATGANYLDASARRGSDGKTAEVFILNRNLDQDLEATMDLTGRSMAPAIAVSSVNAASIREWNSFDEPDRVSIGTSSLDSRGGRFSYRFPAHSITRFTLRLQ